MKHFNLIISLGIMLILNSISRADIPKLINFQGILKDTGGSPLANDTAQVIFTIYDDPSTGNVMWTETDTVTTNSDGLFTLLLGQKAPLPDTAFIGTDRWLSITIGSDPEIFPRTRLASVAYANRVSTVDGASGGTITGESVIKGVGVSDEIVLGVSDPNVAVELRSGTSLGDPYIDFSNDNASDFDARIQLNGNQGLQITVDSTIGIPSGNVGIGTANPNGRLHIRGGSPPRGIIVENDSGSNSDDLRIKRPGAEGPGNPRFSISERSSNSDLWVYGYDGTTFKNFIGFHYPTNVVSMPADGSNLYIDNANSRVGIGTSTPTSPLDVTFDNLSATTPAIAINNSNVAGQDVIDFRFSGASQARIRKAGGGDMFMGTLGNTGVNLLTNDSIRFTVTNAGNVGIGTTSPDEKLTLPYNQYVGWEYSSGNSGVFHKIGKSSNGAGPMEFKTSFNPGPTGRIFSFIQENGGPFEHLSILYNGNVGIGTASPQSTLQVNGYIQLALTSGAPPASDCDAAAERGRMKFDNAAGTLYICGDAGWVTK